MRRGALLALVVACGAPPRPVVTRPPSRFAAGEAQLAIAIVDVDPQADPRARRQRLTLTLTDAAGAVHVLHDRVVDGTCALVDTRARLDDPEADAATLAVVDCPAARPTAVRVTATVERDALRVLTPEGPLEFFTPARFDVVVGE